MRATEIPALTGLRAFAAAAVVAYHLRGLTSSIAPWGGSIRPLLEGGMLGVDVFFVLSGFVIAHTYADRLAEPAPGAIRNYLVARLARVYPLHLVTFLAVVALIAMGTVQNVDGGAAPSTISFIGNLLMLQALPGIPAWNLPAWSICCELAAYLVFPVFAARLLQARWSTALALAATVLCVQIVVMYELGSTALALQSLYWPRIAGEFAAGALLWVVWSRVLRRGLWGDAVVLLCALGSGVLLWQGHAWLLTIPFLAAMVPAAACAVGPVATVLSHPVTQWGGRVSYALYLVHGLVIAALLRWAVPQVVFVEQTTAQAVLVLGGILVLAVAAAAVLHHGVEEPTRRWVRRRFTSVDPGPRGAAGVVAPAQSAPGTPPRETTDQHESGTVGRATIAP